jgi:type IV pilus assembly protein PilA
MMGIKGVTMKSFLKTLKRQDGFTLVELMVVVAIIGLLSAVAIPNFKKYQAKAKISEAKLQLSSIYTAEASFFSDYNMYAHCLTYMGFDPGPEWPSRYFAVGFVTPVAYDAGAYNAAVNSGLNSLAGTGCPNVATAVPRNTASISPNDANQFFAGKGIGNSMANTTAFMPPSTNGTQATAATMIYTAGAGGVISADAATSALNAKLTIDHTKIIRTVTNGF